MSGQRSFYFDTFTGECVLERLDTYTGEYVVEQRFTRISPQRPHAQNSASVKTPSGNPPSTQGTFATPENDSFYKLYSYSDLNSTAQDIRLIHVFKTEHCDLIQCNFLPQSRLPKARRSYHTLSYCAGDPLKAKPVLLQGIKFNVFANLNHALEKTLSVRKSQYPGRKCVLWVDQICINQRSDAERSHQVGLMRDIYTNSQGTFVSLSTADEDNTGRTGMDWLKELEGAHQSHRWTNKDESFVFHNSRSRPCAIVQCILRRKFLDPVFMEGFSSFYELIQTPWWRRAWIHQEFICSPSAIFMYHDSAISSTHTPFLLLLCQALQDIRMYGYLNILRSAKQENPGLTEGDIDLLTQACGICRRASDSLSAIELLLNTKETWRGDEDLKKVLAVSRHCRSSDPRDRIFAFLGLAHPGYGIETDYSKSNTLHATILHTAEKIFGFDRHLEILVFAARATKRIASRLPSWAPDWASTEILHDCHFEPLRGSDEQFQNDAVGSSVIYSTRYSKAALRVRGLLVDTLERILRTWNEPLHTSEFETAGGHTVRCRNFAQEEDELWMLMGSKWPFILRPCDGAYMVVSEAENGVWQGADIDFDEILDQMRNGLETLHTIHLC